MRVPLVLPAIGVPEPVVGSGWRGAAGARHRFQDALHQPRTQLFRQGPEGIIVPKLYAGWTMIQS